MLNFILLQHASIKFETNQGRRRYHVKETQSPFFLIVIACFTTVLTSCYTPAGRSPGEIVDDATITTQIITGLNSSFHEMFNSMICKDKTGKQ